MTDEPSYADLVALEQTLRDEEDQRVQEHRKMMGDLNRRIIAAMQREGIA